MQVSQRTVFFHNTSSRGFSGSTLVGLLARLTDIPVPEPDRSISDRLSHWLRWTDAISLSSVLGGQPAAAAPSRAVALGGTEEAEVRRVHAALLKTLAEDGDAATATTDFSPHRRRYVARQQAMENALGPLRGRLRSALAGRSAAMAQLAAVDMVMEQALSPHEQRVLATVPTLLEKHFNRLRRAEVDRDESPDIWRAGFARDLQSVLLAELEIRMQPIDGLLEALHKR
ncbi:MAG: DUF3348 domain-containing protein [Janthinobacterium lividum]